MSLVIPSWFKQRQGKAEEAGPDTYRLTAPNQGEAFVSIRPAENGAWLAALRLAAGGPDVVVSAVPLPTRFDAWEAAFELYRIHVVV
jgi:hypothetical protein